MSKERIFEPYQKAERSIIKKYRKQLWSPFIYAIKHYDLIQEGDRIAVCISGGKDSMRGACGGAGSGRGWSGTASCRLSGNFW